MLPNYSWKLGLSCSVVNLPVIILSKKTESSSSLLDLTPLVCFLLLSLILLGSYLKIRLISTTNTLKWFPHVHFIFFLVLSEFQVLHLCLLLTLDWFLLWEKYRVKFILLYVDIVFPASFIKEALLFPTYVFGTFWSCLYVGKFISVAYPVLFSHCLFFYASVMMLCGYYQVFSFCSRWLSLFRVFHVSLWILGYFSWFLLLLQPLKLIH